MRSVGRRRRDSPLEGRKEGRKKEEESAKLRGRGREGVGQRAEGGRALEEFRGEPLRSLFVPAHKRQNWPTERDETDVVERNGDTGR